MSEKRNTPPPTSSANTDDDLRQQWEQELGLQALQLESTGGSLDFDSMFATIEEQVEQEAVHSRPWSEWKPLTRIIAVSLISFAICGLVLALKPRADLPYFPLSRMVMILGGMAGFLIVLAWALFRPLYKPELPVWLTHYLLPAIGLLLPGLLSFLSPGESHGLAYTFTTKQLLTKSMVCLVVGTIIAVPFLLLAHRLARHKSPIAFVAMAAAAGGLSGNLTIHVFCPINSMLHLLVGHGTVGFGILLILFLIHRRMQA